MSKKLYDFINYPIGAFTNSPEFKRALNKVLCCTNSGGGGIQSIVAGTNITVDDTDPLNPIVSASGGSSITGTGTNNVLTKWTGATSLGNSLVNEDATTVKIGAVGSQPTYAFGVYGATNGATISAIENALSLESGNTSTSPTLIASRSNTSENVAEFFGPIESVFVTPLGSVQASALAGTGTRMVVADTNGLLSTQAIPSGGGSGWGLTGNSGLSSSTNFIGNTDNIDFNVRVNNAVVAKWNTTEGVSIGSGASVSGQASVALGNNALNSGIAAIALGYQASVGGANNAIALGRASQSNHEGAFTSQDYSGSNVFASNVNHQWKTKFNGGYRLMTGTAVPVELIKAGVDAGKALEVVSTTAMFIPPVMTGTQAEAISPKTEGGMIYSTDGSGVTITSKGWWGWDGSTWQKLN